MSVAWSLAPDPPAVGPAILAIRLTDGRRQPIRGARLRAEADMRHPGMKPVLAAATERGNGLYEAELAFTMAGAWVVVVKGELPDGRDLTHQIDLTNVRSGP